NLSRVGTLVVTSNPKLVSLAGLKGLKHAKSVDISKNRVLAGYFGLLPQLAQVEQQLVLRQNLGLSKHEVSQVMARIPQRQGTQAAAQGKSAAVQ
ncbi:MAG TPA: hypothetical protein VIW29_19755, partial [Polyangiaceae bacterium]